MFPHQFPINSQPEIPHQQHFSARRDQKNPDLTWGGPSNGPDTHHSWDGGRTWIQGAPANASPLTTQKAVFVPQSYTGNAGNQWVMRMVEKPQGPPATSAEADAEQPEENPVYKGFNQYTNLNAKVTNVILEGSTISEKHQDILCKLDSGLFVRFSRNNAGDTAQFGAELGKLPLISQNSPPKDTTLASVLTIFKKVHNSIPLYSQGDCHIFSENMIKEIIGQNTEFGAEDNFM
jgi:hypothetical protein